MIKREGEINYLANEADPLCPTFKASHPVKFQLIAM